MKIVVRTLSDRQDQAFWLKIGEIRYSLVSMEKAMKCSNARVNTARQDFNLTMNLRVKIYRHLKILGVYEK